MDQILGYIDTLSSSFTTLLNLQDLRNYMVSPSASETGQKERISIHRDYCSKKIDGYKILRCSLSKVEPIICAIQRLGEKISTSFLALTEK